MRRRLSANGLLLSVCLLGGAARLYAQPEVIATAVPVAASTPTAPAPPSSAIQPVSFNPDAPSNTPFNPGMAPPIPPTPPSPQPTRFLPPTVSSDEPAANRPTMNPQPPPAATTPLATMLSVEVVGPERLLQGQPLTHEIVLRNNGVRPIAEIHVEEPLPADVRVLRTEPTATTRDHRLIWELRNLEGGGERRLKIEVNPGTIRELDLRPYVTILPGNGLRTRVVRPPFSVEMSADTTKVSRGGRIRFTIQLANNGDTPIHNIKLYDTLPSGLYHLHGPKIGIEDFGDLRPGESRTLSLETTAVESGSFRNEVFAQADFGVEAKAGVDVVVGEPSLTLRVDGPKQGDTLHDLDFRLEVANPGAVPARNVRLVQMLPPTFEVVSAGTGASLDKSRQALVWSLSDLNAGERQTVLFRCKATLAGDWPLSTAVLSRNLAETRVSTMLHAEATAALKLEVQAREERLTVGTETSYCMRVFNKGDAACTGLRLTATLPEAVTPLKTEGPSDGHIEKQQVSFTPLAQLDGHSDVVYRIHVRGRQPGKDILRVELTADKQTPITGAIGIQVEEAARSATNAERANSLSGETLR